MKKIISFLSPIFLLLIGVPLMIGTSALIPLPKLATVIILVVFILYNLIISHFLKLNGRLKDAWSIRKVWHLVIGFFIGLIPIGTAYSYYHFKGELPDFQGVTVSTALLTLVTVGWEELWFRGISLEFGATKYSKLGAVLTFAIIFALLHSMNPKIILIEDGLQLFFAGYALGACYFAFNSIWAPIGLHFSNNLMQALFGRSTEPQTFIYLGPLLLISIIFTMVIWRRKFSDKVL